MKYKYRKLVLKFYLYRYLKHCLNPVKFKQYYNLLTIISKVLLKMGKPFLFLINQMINFKYFLFTSSRLEEKNPTINVYTNNKKVLIKENDLNRLISSLLVSENLIIDSYDYLPYQSHYQHLKGRTSIIREFYQYIYNTSIENQKKIHKYYDIFNGFEEKEIELYSEMINTNKLMQYPWFASEDIDSVYLLPYDLYFYFFFQNYFPRFGFKYLNTFENYIMNQNLTYYYNRYIIEHPDLSLGFKKLFIDVPYLNELDRLTLDYHILDEEEQQYYNQSDIDIYFTSRKKIVSPFFINKYIDTGDKKKDTEIKRNLVINYHNVHFIDYSFNKLYILYLVASEINYFDTYIDIYRQHIHLENIKFIKFFYTYFKLVVVLVLVNLLFGFAAVKLLLSIFLFIGFILLVRAELYIATIKRICILFSFSIAYSFLNITIGIPLLKLIVSFIILKSLSFIIINIGSTCLKLNYPQYGLFNLILDNYYPLIRLLFRREKRTKIFSFLYGLKEKEQKVNYTKYVRNK